MERPVVFSWWFLFFLSAVLSSAAAQKEAVYTVVNGTISLKPETSGPFTNILWKHQGNLVVEWVGGQLDYYGKFNGPATLDIKTGGLVIKTTGDSFAGLYTVETNSQVQAKGYDVKFIKEVTKPVVGVRPLACTHEKPNCTLVCNNDDTSALGPLTYSWREDDGDWKAGDKEMRINNDKTTQEVKTFSCRVKNPISQAESGSRDNPFHKEPGGGSSSGGTAAGIVIGVLLLLGAAGGGAAYWKRDDIMSRLGKNQSGGDVESPASINGGSGNQSANERKPFNETPAPSNDNPNETPAANVEDTAA